MKALNTVIMASLILGACGESGNLNLRGKAGSSSDKGPGLASESVTLAKKTPDGTKKDAFTQCMTDAKPEITPANFKSVLQQCYLAAGGKTKEELQAIIDQAKTAVAENDLIGLSIVAGGQLQDDSVKACSAYVILSHPKNTDPKNWTAYQSSEPRQFQNCLKGLQGTSVKVFAAMGAGAMSISPKIDGHIKNIKALGALAGMGTIPGKPVEIAGAVAGTDGISAAAGTIRATFSNRSVSGNACMVSNFGIPPACLPFYFSIPL